MFVELTFDTPHKHTEPCFGEGLALERPPEPKQDALQGRDVPADGAGSAAAAAGKRAAAGGSAPRQGRPPPGPRNGHSRLKDVASALRFPPDWTWNLFSHPQVRQLDATVLSLKQQKQQSQSSAAKALEAENAALRRELEAQKERSSVRGGHGQEPLESLQQENQALKMQVSQLSSQLIDVGIFPRQNMLICINQA